MKKQFLFFSLLLLSIPFFSAGQKQFSVSGIIRDSATSELLDGANVLVQNHTAGCTSNKSGKFELVFSSDNDQAVLLVRFIGYKEKQFVVSEGQSIVIFLLSKEFLNQPEVIISESKIPQSILESPVTSIQLDAKTIAQLPQENFYAGLASQKGIDIVTNSLFYQQINMRGPSNPFSEAVLQLTDGMDNTPPGQGFSVGNLAGENDLDIESVEIIPGSSSAIYGDNAFSGLINITSKNPFLYRGFSAQLKTGLNFLDGKYHDPAIFNDVQVRYANVWKEKFAVKLDLGYLRGTDWLQMNQADFNPNVDGNPDNPGRDIQSIYGDEIQQSLTLGPDSNSVDVSRTGYNANDLFGTHTNSLKTRTSVYYTFKNGAELSYLFSYSLFNSNVAPATWTFREFSVTYHKVELKSKNYFIRFYTIADHDGHSYEAGIVGVNINSRWKTDSAWFSDYENAYNGIVSGVTPYNHALARNYADIGRVLPGSDQFKSLVDEFSSIPLHEPSGARYEDHTNLQHLHAQYDFSPMFHWMKIISGVEFRSRNLWSNGTMFQDYPPAHYINTKTYSGYVQCEKSFFNDRLSVLASVRIDKYDIFAANVTPRLAAVYKINKKNFIRASFQTGTRVPDPFDEYRESTDGFTYYVGGLPLSDDKYQFHRRGFNANSIIDYSDSVNKYIHVYGADSTDAAIERYKGMLKPGNLAFVHPERVQTAEIGYQCLLLNNKLHLDFDLFVSNYINLISYQWVGVPIHGNPYEADSITAAAADFVDWRSNSNGFSVPVNDSKEVQWGGVEASAEFNFWKDYVISGNFIYQKSSKRDPDVDSWLFQTTPIKTNLSISNPRCWKNAGFSVNWHWTDAVGEYWTGFNHTNNSLPANSVLDAQITFQLPKMSSSIRFGASNLLNHYYQNIGYGASVGGLYYISILYTPK